MIRKVFSLGGTLLLAGAVFLATPGPSQAQRGHFGGAHFGGVRFGGFRGGFNHSGFHFRPNFGGYRGWYHYRPYYGGYYGYNPFYWGYNPYYGGNYGYNPYYGGSYGYNPYYGYTPYFGSYPYDDYAYSAYDPVYSGDYYRPALTNPGGAAPGGSNPVGDQSSSTSALLAEFDTRAHVTVTVPDDARVWFDGSAPSAAGRVRQFVTPPLEAGQQYTYWIRARWDENGQAVNQLQPVEVTAGARVNVQFLALPRTGGKASAVIHE
jgi:uncharacterized protein (TIGR03000 family)